MLFKNLDIELLTTFYLVWLFFNVQKLFVKVGKPKLSAFILAVCIKNGHQMVVNNCLLPDARGPILDLVSLNRFWFEPDRTGDWTNRFHYNSWHTPSFPIFLWRLDRPKHVQNNSSQIKSKWVFPMNVRTLDQDVIECYVFAVLLSWNWSLSLSLVVWANINILTPGICSSPTPTAPM